VLKYEHPMFDFQIPREGHLAELRDKLTRNPVVALLGARQVGKTGL